VLPTPQRNFIQSESAFAGFLRNRVFLTIGGTFSTMDAGFSIQPASFLLSQLSL
jgi:hypothetical protein